MTGTPALWGIALRAAPRLGPPRTWTHGKPTWGGAVHVAGGLFGPHVAGVIRWPGGRGSEWKWAATRRGLTQGPSKSASMGGTEWEWEWATTRRASSMAGARTAPGPSCQPSCSLRDKLLRSRMGAWKSRSSASQGGRNVGGGPKAPSVSTSADIPKG